MQMFEPIYYIDKSYMPYFVDARNKLVKGNLITN